MKKLTIKITQTDPDILEWFKDYEEDSFKEDLLYHLQYLLEDADVEIVKEE